MTQAAALWGAFAAALALSLALVPATVRLARRVGAVDHGGGRRAHLGAVPRLGGVAVFAAWGAVTTMALLAVGGPGSARLAAILGGALLLFAVGCLDDARGVGVRAKLAAQVAAALLVFAAGVRIDVLTNPLGGGFKPGVLELPLTILWLVTVTNAYNLIDGMDGVAATAGLTICLAMSLLYVGVGQVGPVSIAALAGALAGFLRHNFPPARVFLGDSGSQSVGFLLGALSLLAFAKASTLAALLVPVVVFGHPLVDLAYAVLRRYHRGQPLALPDREHLHHKLLDLGLSRRGALGVLVLLNLALLALVLPLASRRLSGWVVVVALLTVPAGVAFRIARHVWRGGSVREEALAFFMNRQRRHVQFLGRQFRRAAPAAADEAALSALVRQYVVEARVAGAVVAQRATDGTVRTLFADGAASAGERLIVCTTVVGPGGAMSLLEVSANREEGGQPGLSDAVGSLAEGVRIFLENRGQVQS